MNWRALAIVFALLLALAAPAAERVCRLLLENLATYEIGSPIVIHTKKGDVYQGIYRGLSGDMLLLERKGQLYYFPLEKLNPAKIQPQEAEVAPVEGAYPGYRLEQYLKTQLVKGQPFSLRSKRGKVYTGIYDGSHEGVIYYHDEGGRQNYSLTVTKLDDSSVPADYRPPEFRAPGTEPVDNTPLINEIENQALREKVRALNERLPEPGRGKNLGYGTVPKLAVVRQVGKNEDLVVMNDPQLDPVLHKWLADTKARTKDIRDPIERARAIAQQVEQTFKYGTGGVFHPIRRWRFNRLEGAKAGETPYLVKLGEFIANRTGSCRHQALALQLALQDAGISSRLVYGELGQVYRLDRREFRPKFSHAWVVISDANGKEYILDPTRSMYGSTNREWAGSASEEARSTRTRRLTSRTGGEDVLDEYVPFGHGNGSGAHELDRGHLRELLPTFLP